MYIDAHQHVTVHQQFFTGNLYAYHAWYNYLNKKSVPPAQFAIWPYQLLKQEKIELILVSNKLPKNESGH